MDGEKIKENINHTYSGRVAAKAANQTIAPVVFPVEGKMKRLQHILQGRVYTVEGNSSDAVSQRDDDINYSCIIGYGVVAY